MAIRSLSNFKETDKGADPDNEFSNGFSFNDQTYAVRKTLAVRIAVSHSKWLMRRNSEAALHSSLSENGH